MKANYQGRIYHFDPSSNGSTGATIRDSEGTADMEVNGRSKLYAYVLDNYFTGIRSYFNRNSAPGTVVTGNSTSNPSPHDALAGKTSSNGSGIVIDGTWYPRFCQPSIMLYNKEVTGPAGGIIHHYENELSNVTSSGQLVIGRSEHAYIARDMELLMAKVGVVKEIIDAGCNAEVIKDDLNVTIKASSSASNSSTYYLFPYFQNDDHITWWNTLPIGGGTGTTLRSAAAQTYVKSYAGKTGEDLEDEFGGSYDGKCLKVSIADDDFDTWYTANAFTLPYGNVTISNAAVSATGELTFDSDILSAGNNFFVRVGTTGNGVSAATNAAGKVTYQLPGTFVAGEVYIIQIWRQNNGTFVHANNHLVYTLVLTKSATQLTGSVDPTDGFVESTEGPGILEVTKAQGEGLADEYNATVSLTFDRPEAAGQYGIRLFSVEAFDGGDADTAHFYLYDDLEADNGYVFDILHNIDDIAAIESISAADLTGKTGYWGPAEGNVLNPATSGNETGTIEVEGFFFAEAAGLYKLTMYLFDVETGALMAQGSIVINYTLA